MACAVAERAVRASAPESVEADLAALWRELASRGPIARAVMSNVIVCRRPDRAGSADRGPDADDPSLDAVMATHPSRTIVLEREADQGQPPVLDATVSVCVFGDPATRYGVEKIVIRTA